MIYEYMIISFFTLCCPDEGRDGGGGEKPPADCPVVSEHRPPDRTSILAACPSQRLQNGQLTSEG